MTHSRIPKILFSIICMSFAVACGKNETVEPTNKGRHETAEIKKSDGAISDIKSKPSNEEIEREATDIVSCTPGCRFELSEESNFGVPEWCESWTVARIQCGRIGDEVMCRRNIPGTERIGGRFKSDQWVSQFELAKLESASATKNTYLCTRINVSRLTYADREKGWDDDEFVTPHLNCRPGCLFGGEPSFPEEVEKQPAWCVYANNGCSDINIDEQCTGPFNFENSCVGIKVKD